MLAQLYMTGKTFEKPSAYTVHKINCAVNDIPLTFTVADDELCTFGIYQHDKLLGYIGRNGMVVNYGEAELINGRFSPKISNASPGTTIRKIESRFIENNRFVRNRTCH